MNICKVCNGTGLDLEYDICDTCGGDGIIQHNVNHVVKNSKQKKSYQETSKPKKMKINKKTGVMEYV